jgi:hypothetical protein
MIKTSKTFWYTPKEKLPEKNITKNKLEQGFSEEVLVLMKDGTLAPARYQHEISKWYIRGYVGDWTPIFWADIELPKINN